MTIPGKNVKLGHRHPMYIALDEIKEIFIGMGFTVLDLSLIHISHPGNGT